MRKEILDSNRVYIAFISTNENTKEEELISTKTGSVIGTYKEQEGTLMDKDNKLIGFLSPVSSSESTVEGEALVTLKRLAGWN